MTEAATLVVLGGGPAQRHAIDAAHALGVRTLVCDSEPGVGDVPVSSEDADGVRAAAARTPSTSSLETGTSPTPGSESQTRVRTPSACAASMA